MPMPLQRKKVNTSTLTLALVAIIVAAALVATVQLIAVQRHLSTADLYSALGQNQNTALHPSGGGGRSRSRRRSSAGRRRGGKADRAVGRGRSSSLPESPTEVVVTSAAEGGPGECRCELLTLDCLDAIACIPATRESLDRSIANGLLTRSMMKVITTFEDKRWAWSTQPIGKVRQRRDLSRGGKSEVWYLLTWHKTKTNRAYNTQRLPHGRSGR